MGDKEKPVVKDYFYWDKILKEQTDEFKHALPNTAEWKAARKAIEEANRELEKWDVFHNKRKKKDEIFPAGSVAEYTRQLKLAEEALSKLNPKTQLDQVRAMQDTILQLTKDRAEAVKQTEILTFQELMDRKRAEYAAFEAAMTTGLTTMAKTQYSELLEGGRTYVDWLNSVLLPLMKKQNEQGSEALGADELAKATLSAVELDAIYGKTSELELYRQKLIDAKEETGSLTEYIQKLNEEMASLGGDTSSTGIAQYNFAKEQRLQAKKELDEMYRQFLLDTNQFNARRLAIEAKYNDLRLHSEKKLQGDMLKEQTKSINRQETEELKALNDEMLAKSDINKQLYEEMMFYTNQEIKEKIRLAKEILEANDAKDDKLKISDEERRRRIIELHDLEMQLAQKQGETWLNVVDSIGNVGASLSGMGGALGGIGDALTGLASAANFANRAYQLNERNQQLIASGKSPDYNQATGMAISGVSQLIAMYANSRRKKKAEKNQRELEGIAFHVELNQLLTEEIRLRTILSENVYIKDYAGRIRDAMDSATDALVKYGNALDTLAEHGKAFESIKPAIDWNNVLAGVTTGASTGLAIGSVFPGYGNIIGAVVGGVVGGVVGLFSKKNKDIYDKLLGIHPELISESGELNEVLAQALLSANQLDDKTKLWLQDLINAHEALKEAKQQITDIVSELTGGMGGELRDALVEAFEQGEGAAIRFADTVENTLENALKNLIYSAVFSKAFSQLQEKLELSLMGSGESFQSIFSQFLNQSSELTEKFNEMMQAAVDEGQKFGFDLFSADNDNRTRMQGSIKSITEEQASLLAGQVNAIRVYQAEANTLVRNQLFHLANIDRNTGEYLPRLDSIDRSLRSMQSAQWWRDMGVT